LGNIYDPDTPLDPPSELHGGLVLEFFEEPQAFMARMHNASPSFARSLGLLYPEEDSELIDILQNASPGRTLVHYLDPCSPREIVRKITVTFLYAHWNRVIDWKIKAWNLQTKCLGTLDKLWIDHPAGAKYLLSGLQECEYLVNKIRKSRRIQKEVVEIPRKGFAFRYMLIIRLESITSLVPPRCKCQIERELLHQAKMDECKPDKENCVVCRNEREKEAKTQIHLGKLRTKTQAKKRAAEEEKEQEENLRISKGDSTDKEEKK